MFIKRLVTLVILFLAVVIHEAHARSLRSWYRPQVTDRISRRRSRPMNPGRS